MRDNEAGKGDFSQIWFEGGAGGVDGFVEAIETGFGVSIGGKRFDELLAVHFVAGGEGEELDDQTRAFARPAGGVEIDAIDYDAERAEQIQFEAGQKGPRRGHEISILAVISPIVEGQGI